MACIWWLRLSVKHSGIVWKMPCKSPQFLQRVQTLSIAELSVIWKPYTRAQWLRKRKEKEQFINSLRDNPTSGEVKAWDLIRYAVNYKHLGYYFKRQCNVCGYAVDFYCYHLKLGIEIDGSVHKGKESIDKYRQDNLQKHGVTLFRFTNYEVFNQPNYVQDVIWKKCQERIAELRALTTKKDSK